MSGGGDPPAASAPADALGVRPACAYDLPAINAIYNHYVLGSTATYQQEPEALANRERWFAAHGGQHPVLVVENAGEVVGWGSLSPFHPRAAFLHTVEDSLYVHHAHHRRGIGRLLLSALIARARAAGHRSIIAAVSGDQLASLRLHLSCGFREAGRLREAGYKFARWLDVVYLQLALAGAAADAPAPPGPRGPSDHGGHGGHG